MIKIVRFQCVQKINEFQGTKSPSPHSGQIYPISTIDYQLFLLSTLCGQWDGRTPISALGEKEEEKEKKERNKIQKIESFS